MYYHIALYHWKLDASGDDVARAMSEVEALADKVPGIVEISTGVNESKYSEGYSHVILVRGESQEAIDNYRKHPDHVSVANLIDGLEESGVGVDFHK